jgi:hypothetical protein
MEDVIAEACSMQGREKIPKKPENFNERDFLKNVGIDGRIILKWILNEHDHGMWIGFIWLRIGISDRRL